MFSSYGSKARGKEFEEKLSETMDALYNTAVYMTRNRDDAEDLVQDASLKAYRNFHRFKEGTNFRAWIMTVLRNTYINQYRKKQKEPREVEFREEVTEKFAELPESPDLSRENFSEGIAETVDNLPEKLRTPVVLFYSEGFSYKEIAGIMGVPVGTVMSRLYNARQILKRQLSGHQEKG